MRALLPLAMASVACLPRAPESSASPHAHAAEVEAPTRAGIDKIRIGLQPVLSPERIEAANRALAVHLEERLGAAVEIVVGESYDAVCGALLEGRIDAAQVGPLSFVTMESRTEIEPLVTSVVDGSTSYSGYIVARADLPFRQIEDLRGRRFGFVSRESASGYLVALDFLVDAGLQPERDFAELRFLGRHDAVIDAVASGELDAGATFSGALLEAESAGTSGRLGAIKIIAKTGRIPNDTWIVARRLPPAARAALKAALLSLSTYSEEGRRVLSPLGKTNGFAPFRASDFDRLREVRAQLLTHGAGRVP